MTTPLQKPVSRLVAIRSLFPGAEHVVTMTQRGIELRRKGKRFTLFVPWSDILARGEHLAGETRRREQLRAAVTRRIRTGAVR